MDRAMNHQTIERDSVAERYVAGKLSAAELALFEEHYLDCPACIDRVEEAERLARGLGRVAAEETARVRAARRLGFLAMLAALGRRRGALAGAFLVVLLAVPAGLGLWHMSRLSGDLEAARTELAAARRPGANTSVVALSPFRGSGVPGSGAEGAGPVHPVKLPAEPGWVVLSLDAAVDEEGSPYSAYRALLLDGEERLVWESSGLESDASGRLHLSFHSTFLTPGAYLLRLDGLAGRGDAVPVARFPLLVER